VYQTVPGKLPGYVSTGKGKKRPERLESHLQKKQKGYGMPTDGAIKALMKMGDFLLGKGSIGGGDREPPICER